ncbi:MAG TPA: nuclear transport factor 2 family protein [Polyangia bacterium]|jgi:ketosteroid isomerase-like protein|nr:nuclear transport factor 2 family protein [Polyangia bacterium]
MHPHAELIERFYRCFQARDGAGMAACYAPDVTFSDPVFPRLEGEKAGAMWRMLCGRAADLEIQFSDVQADDTRGSARWVAHYTFTKTGRRVENRITASFELRNGAIVRHEDRFDFWRWSRQALGPAGLLLGWSPMLQRKVQAEAAHNLERFLSKQ